MPTWVYLATGIAVGIIGRSRGFSLPAQFMLAALVSVAVGLVSLGVAGEAYAWFRCALTCAGLSLLILVLRTRGAAE